MTKEEKDLWLEQLEGEGTGPDQVIEYFTSDSVMRVFDGLVKKIEVLEDAARVAEARDRG